MPPKKPHPKSPSYSHSALAQILRKKRAVRPRHAKKIEAALKIEFGFTPANSARSEFRLNDVNLLSQNTDLPWYYGMFLEYLKIAPQPIDEMNLASRLSVPVAEIRNLLQICLKNKILRKNNDHYEFLNKSFSSNFKKPISDHRTKSLQKTYLHKALDSVDNTKFEERLHSTMAFRFDRNKLAEVKACIEKFFRDLARLTSKNEKTADSVYLTQISTFPVIRIENTTE